MYTTNLGCKLRSVDSTKSSASHSIAQRSRCTEFQDADTSGLRGFGTGS